MEQPLEGGYDRCRRGREAEREVDAPGDPVPLMPGGAVPMAHSVYRSPAAATKLVAMASLLSRRILASFPITRAERVQYPRAAFRARFSAG